MDGVDSYTVVGGAVVWMGLIHTQLQVLRCGWG